jgi:hypothetical protein
MRAALLVLPVTIGACANTMIGQVEGERVGHANESIFQVLSYEQPGIGSLTGVGIIVTGARDSCEGLSSLEEVSSDCVDSCEELEELASQHLPGDEIWSMVIWMISNDTVEGHYLHMDQADFDGFGATIEQADVSALHDYDTCLELCAAGEDTTPTPTTANSTGGWVELDLYESAERLEGSYAIEFGDDLVEGHFSAGWCQLIDIF